MGKFSISTSLLIRAAIGKGLECTFLPENVIQISNGKLTHLFKGTSLPCNSAVAARLSCNKYFLRRLLKKENLPTPQTISLRHPAAWQTALKGSLRFPLVVKPVSASHANGATLNIINAKELKQAVARAFSYMRKNKKGNRVLVEEYFEGHDLRLMVVGNHVVSVVKREPAYVIGNGKSTIRELIHTFNTKWQSSLKYDLPLCPIPLDREVSRYLARTGLSLNSVLPKNKKAYVRWNANVSTGGRPSDVTDQIHPNLKKLAIQIARLSHLEVSGVDILCKNLASGDMSAKNISILEINDSPGFDIHHFPVKGESRDVTGAILDYIFDTPNKTKKTAAASIVSGLHINLPHSGTIDIESWEAAASALRGRN